MSHGRGRNLGTIDPTLLHSWLLGIARFSQHARAFVTEYARWREQRATPGNEQRIDCAKHAVLLFAFGPFLADLRERCRYEPGGHRDNSEPTHQDDEREELPPAVIGYTSP